MAERKRIGDILKEAGLVDDFQIESALSHQKNWGGKLGAILVEMGFLKEEDVTRALAQSLRIPYVNLFEPEILVGVVKLIKRDIAKKYTVMPARKEGTALILGMADPLDIAALDEIRFITGLNIQPALATASEINDAIRKYYDHEQVTRGNPPAFENRTQPADKMEIIRESEMKIGEEWRPAEAQEPEQQSKPEAATARQGRPADKVTDRLLIDALTSLLIEKELISREELIRMIEQKKMGL